MPLEVGNKGQILADFIAEMSYVQPRDLYKTSWLLEIDGSSKAVGKGTGMVLRSRRDYPLLRLLSSRSQPPITKLSLRLCC